MLSYSFVGTASQWKLDLDLAICVQTEGLDTSGADLYALATDLSDKTIRIMGDLQKATHHFSDAPIKRDRSEHWYC